MASASTWGYPMNHTDAEWIPITERQPERSDGDERGLVFVWHVFQCAMLIPWDRIRENPFHTHWMPMGWIEEKHWIDRSERLPTADDSDELHCVLVRHCHDGNKVTGWHQIAADRQVERWMPLPKPPTNYRELRRMT